MASPRIRRVLVESSDGHERATFRAVIFGTPGNDAILTIARDKWPLRKLRYKYSGVITRNGEELLVLIKLKG